MAKLKTIIGPPLVRCLKCKSTDTVVRNNCGGKPAIRRRQCRKCCYIFNVQDPDKRLSDLLHTGMQVIIRNCDKLIKKIDMR